MLTNVSTLFRPENMKAAHEIPLGSLVEVNIEYSPEHGIRLFVVEHARDCDGTPLYGLSWDKDIIGQDITIRPGDRQPITQMKQSIRDSITGGFHKDSLIVIKSA